MLSKGQLRQILSFIGIQVTKETEDWLIFSCPVAKEKHSSGYDRKPSAGVTNKANEPYWHCFTCKSSGSLSYLVYLQEKKTGKDFSSIKDDLLLSEDSTSFECVPEEHEDVVYPDNIASSLYCSAFLFVESIEYLNKRNISEQDCITHQIGYDEDDKRIVLPIYNRFGAVVSFNKRSINGSLPKVIFDKGFTKDRHILGIHFWKKDRPTILVEGDIDYIRMYSYFNEDYNVGASLGSSLSSNQLNLVLTYSDTIYIFYDNDKAGRIGALGYDPLSQPNQRQLKGIAGAAKEHANVFMPSPKSWPANINDPDGLTKEEALRMVNMASLIA